MTDYAGSEQKFIGGQASSTIGGYQTDFAPSFGSVCNLGDSGEEGGEVIRTIPKFVRDTP